MNAEVFVDTNVLLYTIDEDPASLSKRQRAQHLLLSERRGWSVQVAAEFFVNATSAKRRSAATLGFGVERRWRREILRGAQDDGERTGYRVRRAEVRSGKCEQMDGV